MRRSAYPDPGGRPEITLLNVARRFNTSSRRPDSRENDLMHYHFIAEELPAIAPASWLIIFGIAAGSVVLSTVMPPKLMDSGAPAGGVMEGMNENLSLLKALRETLKAACARTPFI